MTAKYPFRRKIMLLLAIVLFTAAGCNMPGIAPKAVDLFPTPSEIPFEALILALTGTPPATIPPGGMVAPTESPSGRQFIQAGPQETEAALPTGPSSTPPPTITAAAVQCRVPAVTAGQGQALVHVYFHCDEELTSVPRLVPQGSTDELAHAALQALLAGPTAAEQEAGYTSWFSSQTSSAIRSLILNPNGQVIVDLTDISAVIPNASTSAGSKMLIDQVSATLFQFPEYQSLLLTFEGDCDRFWNWLQMSCSLVDRTP
jgi:hypothetical protein